MPSMILTALLTSLFAVVDGSTVAVLEIGKGGVVRRTTTTSPSTSTAGVVSFLKSVHQNGNENQSRDRRVTQHAGMGGKLVVTCLLIVSANLMISCHSHILSNLQYRYSLLVRSCP